MLRWMAVLPIIALTGCATTSSSLVHGMTAPNPSGCYIQVFDAERLRGTKDFINGPMRYNTLANMPNGADWARRIRSVEVGPAATATIWTGPNRSGSSMLLRLDRPYFTLPADFSGKVQSMDLRCDDSRIAHTSEPNAIAAAK
jgi:hypothetical protein